MKLLPGLALRILFFTLISALITPVFGPGLSNASLHAASSNTVQSAHTRVQIISKSSALQAGKPLLLGLHMRLDKGWHTYWKNPGDSGLATKIKWELPPGFQAGEIIWPTPHTISTPPLMSYGYDDEVLLMTSIQVPENVAGQEIEIKARVDWLECAEVCLPGKGAFTLKIPVLSGTDRATPVARWRTHFQKYQARVARLKPPIDLKLSARADAEKIRLDLKPGSSDLSPGTLSKAYFYVDQGKIVDHPAPQNLVQEGTSHRLFLTRSSDATEYPDKIRGILSLEFNNLNSPTREGPKGERLKFNYQVELPVERVSSVFALDNDMTLWLALALSFLGGIILNLMPCVLPVLSLKIVNIVNQAGESRARAFSHGMVFTLGVLVSFWLLAGVMLILRAGGASLGWGFQLQSAPVVAILSGFLLVFALNMLGVFEIGTSLMSLGSGAQTPGGGRSEGLFSSFSAGVLATIVATPCTAPFMGSALGYAMVQPAWIALLIFTALALGLAFPYITLSAFPAWLRFLPRPGAWMESLKQAMGFLLLASVIWLLWLLGRLTGVDALALVLLALLLVGAGAWLLGRFALPHLSLTSRLSARVGSFVLLLLAVFTGFLALRNPAAAASVDGKTPTGTTASTNEYIAWRTFSPELLKELRDRGRPVFIDFTADWCVSCKVNEMTSLNRADVAREMQARGIVPLKADWTRRDDTIARTLESFGRNGVPLYVLYDGKSDSPPQILPELLTPGIVLEAFKKVEPLKN